MGVVIVTSESAWRSRVKNVLRVLAIVGPIALLFVPLATGTPEYTTKEKKACVYCHTSHGKPDLNDAGKYYKMNKTLKGYVEKK